MSTVQILGGLFSNFWPETRRGLCLWMFAFAFVMIGGVNYIYAEPSETKSQSLSFAFELAGPHFWGWLMTGSGILALASSYLKNGRDRFGFTFLATFCAAWGSVYVTGFMFYDAGLRALSGSTIWFLFSGVLVLIAGFPNVALRQPPLVIVDESDSD